METLFERIKNTPTALDKFKRGVGHSACIYPKPYEGKAEVVRWFYSRNNQCQVFFACSKEVSDIIEEDSWADVSYEFTVYVEHELFDYCIQNTEWGKCNRYGIEYDEKIPENELAETDYHKFGCSGTICSCEPFGEGDFTYGIAEESEFIL